MDAQQVKDVVGRVNGLDEGDGTARRGGRSVLDVRQIRAPLREHPNLNFDYRRCISRE